MDSPFDMIEFNWNKCNNKLKIIEDKLEALMYVPGGPGAIEAKKDFETLSINNSK